MNRNTIIPMFNFITRAFLQKRLAKMGGERNTKVSQWQFREYKIKPHGVAKQSSVLSCKQRLKTVVYRLVG
jgi:hypothetical protein